MAAASRAPRPGIGRRRGGCTYLVRDDIGDLSGIGVEPTLQILCDERFELDAPGFQGGDRLSNLRWTWHVSSWLFEHPSSRRLLLVDFRRLRTKNPEWFWTPAR